MPIIRRKLDPNTVYPDDLRYDEGTDTVQRNVNGVWKDSPESDPRHQTTIPPRITSDPACDAAQSVVDALKSQIDQIIVAIDGASTAFTIAGLILGLFTFGPFAIFIAIALFIADQMIAAGSTALEAVLTEAVYDELKCILYCHMDTSGRLNEGALPTVQTEVDTEIGGLAATILNAMLSLAGEGGINNLGALGEATGDCSLCDCVDTWCFTWNFASTQGGWVFTASGFGVYTAGTGFTGQPYGTGGGVSRLERTFADSMVTSIQVLHTAAGYTAGQKLLRLKLNANPDQNHSLPGALNGTDILSQYNQAGFVPFEIDRVTLFWDGAASSNMTIKMVTIRGVGTNPFGTDNCV
jgi:hypothetical protein